MNLASRCDCLSRKKEGLSQQKAPGEKEATHCITPLLILVIRRAGPNLHLCPIRIDSLRHIKALIAVDLDYSSSESPLLGGGIVARLNSYNSTVRVGGRRQALSFTNCKVRG